MNTIPQSAQETFLGRITHLLRLFFIGTSFAGFALGASLLGFVLPLLWLAGGSPLERRKRCERMVGYSYRTFHAYMRICGLIDYRPRLHLPPWHGPRVLVANHPSLIDVTAILAARPEACCLVKAAIYRSPFFYLVMKFCGHICVDTSHEGATNGVIEQAIRRIEEGSDVLLFPEGTRSPTNVLGEFHHGAFAVAVHCEVPVAPILISWSGQFLKKGSPWYLVPPEPIRLRLTALAMLSATTDESIRHFSQRVRDSLSLPLPK